MFRECRTCGKEIPSIVKICPNCNTIKYIGLKIDHVIILIVVIVLSITILKTYAIESGYQKGSTAQNQPASAPITHQQGSR